MGQGASKAAKSAAEVARDGISKQRDALNRVSPGGPFGYTGGKSAADAVPSSAKAGEIPSADVSAVPKKSNLQSVSRLATYSADAEHTRSDSRMPSEPRKLEKATPVQPMEMLFVKGKGVNSSTSSSPVLPSLASTPAQTEEEERITDTTPRDVDAAEVQRAAQIGVETVAVQRLLASGPAAREGAKLHDKNTETVTNLTDLSFKPTGDTVIQALPATASDPGMRQLAVWSAMQANPDLLDTPAALARSSTAIAALAVLQLAKGNTAAAPPGTVLKSGFTPLGRPSSPQPQAQAQPGDGEGLGTQGAQQADNALMVIERTADSLVPVGKTLDDVLIAVDPSLPAYAGLRDVVAWGPRPPESSVYDQLIISEREEDMRLERAEVFELFARIRADPLYWTPERLSEFYGTSRSWVEALVDSVSPPLLTVHEGEAYGVYDIRPMEDVEKPIKSYRELWAEAEQRAAAQAEAEVKMQ